MFSGNVTKVSVSDLLDLVALPELLCLFPVYRARAVYERRTGFLFQRTLNGKLADHEEIFSEFDEKCVGLESYTTPFKVYLHAQVWA